MILSIDDGFYTSEEIRERLSVSTVFFWLYRPVGERSLGELARHGIKRIELLESPEQFNMADRGSMRFVAEACRANGIEVAAYHAHKTDFTSIGTETERRRYVDGCRKQIDTMLELGGRIWGSHARAMDDTLRKSCEDLARHIEGIDAAVVIENFVEPGVWVEDRVAFLDGIGHPQVGMILDIGHVRDREGRNPMTTPEGPARVVALCAKHLRHVHLHGFKDGVDHFPPLVEGDEIRWVELFKALRETGYSGLINFEVKGEPKHRGALEYVSRAPDRIAAQGRGDG